jgi:putative flippase GtrA
MLSPDRMRPALLDRLSQLIQNRALMLKAASFALVGVVNTVVDFIVFSFTHLWLGLPIIAANILSWIVAVTGSYVLNTLVTFAAESEGKLRAGTYLSFAGSQVGGLVGNTATVLIASYFMPVLAGKVLAIGVSFLVNFLLSHLVVFRRRRTGPDRAG